MIHDTQSFAAPGAVFHADDMVRALVANELDALRAKLEDVGVELCLNADVAARHGPSLQGIDELAQRSQNLAMVLRADAMEGAIEAITLESLKERLLDAVTVYLAELAEREDRANPWTPV